MQVACDGLLADTLGEIGLADVLANTTGDPCVAFRFFKRFVRLDQPEFVGHHVAVSRKAGAPLVLQFHARRIIATQLHYVIDNVGCAIIRK